jgi:ABC-type phosphate transport system substrate-binding protein
MEKPEVLGFVKFYLDNAEALVAEVGYINIPEGLLAEMQAKIEPFLP